MTDRKEEIVPPQPAAVDTGGVPVQDSSANSASELIEAPQQPKRNKLDPHDFADGGGSGGAEAYRRAKAPD
jgi:hypothetical protein